MGQNTRPGLQFSILGATLKRWGGRGLKTHGMIYWKSQGKSWVLADSWIPSQMASFLDLSEQ